ncbi:MAG: FtsX-like permease family protein, partial [Bacteroidota bacterium]
IYKEEHYARTSPPLASLIEHTLPEIKKAIRLYQSGCIVNSGKEPFTEMVHFVDTGFFDFFSFPFAAGNPDQALNRPQQIVITESYALKYFGDVSAIGKSLFIRGNNWEEPYEFIVAGIIKNLPPNSSIQFGMLVPLTFLEQIDYSFQPDEAKWRSLGANTFIELNNKVHIRSLEDKITKVVNKDLLKDNYSYKKEYTIVPFSEIHFSNIQQNIMSNSSRKYVYILASLGLLILIIACINFTTLSISQSTIRTKEVGIRKAMGAHRIQLVLQFLGEAFLLTLLAFIFGYALLYFILPSFNSLIGKTLSINILRQPIFLGIIFLLLLLTALFTGVYPAFALSRFNPDVTLRNRFKMIGKKQLIATLSTIQFAISSFLIICTLFMNGQLDKVFKQNLGFEEEFVVKLHVPYKRGNEILNRYRDVLSSEVKVKSVSGSWQEMGNTQGANFSDFYNFQVENTKLQSYSLATDPELLQTLQIELLTGERDFWYDDNTSLAKVLVNEQFVKEVELSDLIGKIIEFPDGKILIDMFEKAEIIGVVKDFHYQSMHHEIQPLIIHTDHPITHLYVRLEAENIVEGLALLEKKWKTLAADLPFDYSFLDEDIQKQYEADVRWLTIGFYASGLAIIIACLGLFGLASYTSAQRIKEIGIRKVLGASVSSILILFTKDYFKLVVIAFVISIPIANYFIIEWLAGFAYKIEITWWFFALPCIIILTIALIAVGGQSIKAASKNPIN